MASEVEPLEEASGIKLKRYFDDTEDWFVGVPDDAELIVDLNKCVFSQVILSEPEGA